MPDSFGIVVLEVHGSVPVPRASTTAQASMVETKIIHAIIFESLSFISDVRSCITV
jgi:hypothetical protein